MINVETHTTTPHYLEELHELLYGELVSDLQVAYSVVLSAPEAYCDANSQQVSWPCLQQCLLSESTTLPLSSTKWKSPTCRDVLVRS